MRDMSRLPIGDSTNSCRYCEVPKPALTSKFHQVIAKKMRKTAPSASKSKKTPEAAPEVAVSPPAIYVLSKQSP